MSEIKITKDINSSFDSVVNERYAALVSRSEVVSNDLHLIKCFDRTQTFASLPIALFVNKKNLAIVSSSNRIIRHAFEGGLIKLWRSRFVRKKYKNINLFEIDTIQMHHLTFLYVLMLAMISLSILLFLGEIIIFRKAKSPNANAFWLFMHKACHGKRYFCIYRMNANAGWLSNENIFFKLIIGNKPEKQGLE